MMGFLDIFKKTEKRSASAACVSTAQWKDLCSDGYTKLSNCPEIVAAIDTISQLIGSMTIYLEENRYDEETGEFLGDIRVRDGLARMIDVTPNKHMTRATFMTWIAKVMLLEGNAIVKPITRKGFVNNLEPIPPNQVGLYMTPDKRSYYITINGEKKNPDDFLHFAANISAENPYIGEGYKVQLRPLANTLKQAEVTKQGFMSSNWKPSMIIRVDADSEQMASPEGRADILSSYVKNSQAGTPWILPADLMQVEQVKPLTLNDLAINDSVKLDKKTVAAVLGIPSFVLGEGEFKKDEWNNFINTKVMYWRKVIEQEMTRKLLYSPDRYFRFNVRSLFAYDMGELANVGYAGVERGTISRNEVRDWLMLDPVEGLDEMIALENYIPTDRLGDQKKLIESEEPEDADSIQ